MYLGVDIGGTKTLVGVLDDNGVINEEHRFDTPKDYKGFLNQLKVSLSTFENKEFAAAAVAVPGVIIDRNEGIAANLGNLPWPKVHIADDIEALTMCPVIIENDAKLAGLSEAMLLKNKYSKILYLTISTGIGVSVVNNLEIDENAWDSGGKTMMFRHSGQIVDWESFASGKSIANRFGKMAHEINDDKTWRAICSDLATGIIQLVAIFQPEVVIIGGSVGKYFEKYGQILKEELKKYEVPLLRIPVLIGAQRADNAVIYGCYDLARKRFPHE